MKCRLTCEAQCVSSRKYPKGVVPEGTELEFPEAWRLVRRGMAVPADDECAQKAAMGAARLAAAQQAYRRVAAGIHPDDTEAFEAGVMTGYNADGTWKPGPHFDDYDWQRRKQESPLVIVEE